MAREKISVTMAEETYALVKKRAAAEGMTVSAWLDRAAYREAMRAAYVDHAAMLAAAEEKPSGLAARYAAQAERRRAWRLAQGQA